MDLDRDEAVTKVKKELIFPGITALHHFAWNGDVEAVQTILDLPTWPCTVFLLECVNAGSFKAWRAEKAREMLFLRRLFTRQHRHASRDDLSLTHRLFLLRDDALFLRCLEYCWFLDPWKRVPSETDYRRVFETAATESES